MDFWSGVALGLLLAALLVVGWGLFSPTSALPAWTHRLDKLWHIIAFAGLAFFTHGVWPQTATWQVWLTLSLAGFFTEVLQERYAPGRHFSWGDAAANTLGASLGLVVAAPLWTFARHTV
jgi:VanZ family protein